ncbi:MAG: ScpA family protein [Patescibacteria group bacterium]
MDAFTVRQGEFEGPLHLLLNLIEERKMLISDVSLSAVADSFLTYIKEKTAFPVGEASQFIVVAATLLLLKSRALLPVLSLSDDEEGDVHDLERRLQLLQIIRGAAKELWARSRMFIGGGVSITDPLFTPAPDLTQVALHDALVRVLTAVPMPHAHDEVEVQPVISLNEMIDRMVTRVQQALSLSFKEFAGGATDPREVVVGFLALLELVKQGFAHVDQDGHFNDIRIEYAGNTSVPKYD